jgi:hypothetical protein
MAPAKGPVAGTEDWVIALSLLIVWYLGLAALKESVAWNQAQGSSLTVSPAVLDISYSVPLLCRSNGVDCSIPNWQTALGVCSVIRVGN